MNFEVTVLKILVSHPEGFAVMEDLKRDMAILATSGREWADRTKRLAARVPDLDIFSQGLVDRESGGWKITPKGRAVLEFMEAPRPRRGLFGRRSRELPRLSPGLRKRRRWDNRSTGRSAGASAGKDAARRGRGRAPRCPEQRSW
ncbi:hypothetical protein ABIG06_000486 [Bradyrhizobium sp. USDA 326]